MAGADHAEGFAHSPEMHALRYCSMSPRSDRDQIFYDWWRALGAKGFNNVASVTGDDRPHTDDELLKSLQHVLAISNASFRKDQLEACRHVANCKTQNAIVGMDCGAAAVNQSCSHSRSTANTDTEKLMELPLLCLPIALCCNNIMPQLLIN